MTLLLWVSMLVLAPQRSLWAAAPEPAVDETVASPNGDDAAPATRGEVWTPAWRFGPKQELELGVGASYWLRGELQLRERERELGLPQRVRGRLWLRYRGLTTHLEVQDVREWGEGDTRTTGTTGLGEGYAELAGEGRSGVLEGRLRLGRQRVAWGSERLIGEANWNPHGRAFDGLRAYGRAGPVGVELLGAMLRAPIRSDGLDDPRARAGEWLGAAQLFVAVDPWLRLETHLLARNREPSEDEPERHRLVLSPGLRLLGEPVPGLHYELEGYLQRGHWDGRPHRAWALASKVRYRVEGPGELRTTLVAGYAMASGTPCKGDPGDGCVAGVHREFDGFFGSRHTYLGFADLFAFSNVRDLELGPDFELGEWFELRARYHYFQLHESRGAWRRSNGTLVGRGWDRGNHEHGLGHEFDFDLRLRPLWPLTLELGYSPFVPDGAGPKLLGSRAAIHRVHLRVEVKI